MARLMVTGGAGFVGATLVRQLLAAGQEVRIVDDLSTGREAHLEGLGEHVSLERADIRDTAAVRRAAQGVEAVVHLAARSGVPPSVADPRRDFEVNVQGLFEVLDAARAEGVGRVAFASSGAVLAGCEPPLHEALAPEPLSPYGASKLYGEATLAAFAASYGMVCVSLRFANVYGPFCADKTSVVAVLLKHALAGRPLPIDGDGAQTRDFIHVSDIARGVIAGLAAEHSGVFHLGTGRETSILDLARAVADIADVPFEVDRRPARPGDPPRNFPDTALARDRLGWAAGVDLPVGLDDTLAWLRDSRAEQAGPPETATAAVRPTGEG